MEKVIKAIIEGEMDGKVLVKLVHGRRKNKHGHQVISDSLSGFITPAAGFNLKQLTEELQLIRRHESECLEEMERMSNEMYAKEVELLDTIPGIGKQSAMTIVAELGVDLRMLATASALVWLARIKTPQ